MEKLKQALIQFTHSNPSLFPHDAANTYPVLIEQCFPQFFKDFHTPNHPPYAAMIYKAILELNKKGGSSEKSISEYIQKEYAELPWAHSTLLKHHLEKLCDQKEVCMTDKQCYLLAGTESESEKKSSGTSKKCKKQKSGPDSEAGKKSSRPHKKYKKKEKGFSGIQDTGHKEQIGLRKRKRKQGLKYKKKSSKRAKKHTINEDAKLQLLGEANLKQNNEVNDDESHGQKQTLEHKMGDIQAQKQNGLHKRKRKQGLKSKRKGCKHAKKHMITEDTKLQLLDEAHLEQNNDVSHEQKQIVEVNSGDILVQEQNGLQKRKRKQRLKSKSKRGKHAKKHVMNEDTKLQLFGEANLELNNDITVSVSHEQNQIVEVNWGDIQVQEQNKSGQVLDHDNSGLTNSEQTQTKKNPEVLLTEESPDSNPILHGYGKRVWTRSQSKIVSKKDAALAGSSELTDTLDYANTPKDKPDIVEYVSNGKQQAMEIISVKSTVDTEQQLSRSPSLDKPLIEFMKPMSLKLIPLFPEDEPTTAPSSTEVQDSISSQQDQQPEKLQLDDKFKYKRRGRPPKTMEPEMSKVKSQHSAKKLISRITDDEPTATPSSTEVPDPISSQQDQQLEKLSLDDKFKYKRRGRPPKSMEPEISKVKSQQSAKKLISQLTDDEPTAAPSSTEVQDPISSEQDQQTEKLPLDEKPKHKRRGRPPKRMKPEKSKVKSQQLAKKCKAGKKKGHPKYKGHGMHKMARRSSRKPCY